jgi:uncharacterized membrane protein YGL010W
MTGRHSMRRVDASIACSKAVSDTIRIRSTRWFTGFHAIEGRKPAFVDDLRSFQVAPAWLLGDLYRRFGFRY